MRSAPTDAEAILWRQFRAHRFSGYKFKRQQPLGNYIVDFVCFGSKIVVEVDGGQHNESVEDSDRDDWLKSQGFLVLRFWNNDVLQNIEGVLTRIFEVLAPSLQPLSHEGREAKGSARRTTQEAAASKVLNGDSKRLASLSPRGRGIEGEGVGS